MKLFATTQRTNVETPPHTNAIRAKTSTGPETSTAAAPTRPTLDLGAIRHVLHQVPQVLTPDAMRQLAQRAAIAGLGLAIAPVLVACNREEPSSSPGGTTTQPAPTQAAPVNPQPAQPPPPPTVAPAPVGPPPAAGEPAGRAFQKNDGNTIQVCQRYHDGQGGTFEACDSAG
jgi:hypothetical protein